MKNWHRLIILAIVVFLFYRLAAAAAISPTSLPSTSALSVSPLNHKTSNMDHSLLSAAGNDTTMSTSAHPPGFFSSTASPPQLSLSPEQPTTMPLPPNLNSTVTGSPSTPGPTTTPQQISPSPASAAPPSSSPEPSTIQIDPPLGPPTPPPTPSATTTTSSLDSGSAPTIIVALVGSAVLAALLILAYIWVRNRLRAIPARAESPPPAFELQPVPQYPPAVSAAATRRTRRFSWEV